MIQKSEDLAKSSAEKSIPRGIQFDHRSLMLQFRALETKRQLYLDDIKPGKTAPLTAPFQAGT
jgi:hypothetical protein